MKNYEITRSFGSLKTVEILDTEEMALYNARLNASEKAAELATNRVLAEMLLSFGEALTHN
jgi:hypothetical protein